jgi:parallel beta-helix repeat protein
MKKIKLSLIAVIIFTLLTGVFVGASNSLIGSSIHISSIGQVLLGESYRIYQISGTNYIQDAAGRTVYSSLNVEQTFSTAFSLVSSGGTITVSPGVYTATASVHMQNCRNLKLVFEDGAILTIADNVNAPVLFLQSCSNIQLVNLFIDGNRAGQTTAWITDGILMYNCNNCSVINSTITNCYRDGVAISDDESGHLPSGIVGCTVTFCGWNGITLGAGSEYTVGAYAINNTVAYCSDVGITSYGVGSIIVGNYIYDMNGTTSTQAHWGIGVEAHGYSYIARNIISNCGSGIVIAPDVGFNVSSNLIIDNEVYNCSTGICAADDGYDVITRNKIIGWGSSYAFGITLYWGKNYIASENLLINNLNNNEIRSIYTYSISNSSIYNNTITAKLTVPYSYGISLEKTNKIILEKNRIQAKYGVIIASDCANNLIYQNDLSNCTEVEITNNGQNTTINPPYLETCTLIINSPSIYGSINPPAGVYNYLNSLQVSITLTPNPNHYSVLNIDGVNVRLTENSYIISMEGNHVVYVIFPKS